MSKNKIVLAIFAIIASGLVGLYFYAQSAIKPNEVKQTIKVKLEKSLPGATVSLGDLQVKYGPTIVMTIKGIDILLKKEVMKKRDLLQVGEAKVRLPLVSLLTGGGNLEIALDNTELFLHRKSEKKGNWKEAFDNAYKDQNQIEKNSPAKNTQNILLPAFLINSTLALRLKDFKVYYDIDDKVGVWSANKVLIKNLGLNSNAAFEVKSHFKRVADNKEKFSFGITLIGSIEFSKYLKTGQLNLNSNLKINDLKLNEGSTSLPIVRGNTTFTLEKNGNLSGEVKTIFRDSQVDLKLNVTGTKKVLTFNKSQIKVTDIREFVDHMRWGPLAIEQVRVTLDGRIELENDKLTPFLKYEVTNLQVVKDQLNLGFNGNGTVDGKQISSKLSSTSLGGNLSAVLDMTFDINSNESFDNRMSFYKLDITGAGVTLSPAVLKLLKREDEKDQPESKGNFFLLPKGLINITLEKALLPEKSVVSGGLTFKTERDIIEVKNGSLLTGDGKLTFKGSGQLYKNDIGWKLKAEMTDWSLSTFTPFITKKFPYPNGVASGKISLNGKNRPLNIEKIDVDLKSAQGNWSGFDLNILKDSYDSSLARNTFLGLSPKLRKKLSTEYRDLAIEAMLGEGQHKLKSISFLNDYGHQVILKGNVDPEGLETKRVKVWVKDDQTVQKVLSKKARLKTLPMAFWSKGYEFKEDPLYSVTELAKKLRLKKDKTKAKQIIKKVKNSLNEDKNEKS